MRKPYDDSLVLGRIYRGQQVTVPGDHRSVGNLMLDRQESDVHSNHEVDTLLLKDRFALCVFAMVSKTSLPNGIAGQHLEGVKELSLATEPLAFFFGRLSTLVRESVVVVGSDEVKRFRSILSNRVLYPATQFFVVDPSAHLHGDLCQVTPVNEDC